MTRRRPHLLVLRPTAALGLAAAFLAMTAPMSQALGLPEPVSTAVGAVTTPVGGVTGGLGLPVPRASTPAPSGSASSSAPGRPSSATTGGGPASGPTRSPSGTSSPSGESSPSGASTTDGSGSAAPGGPSGAAVDSPAATVCLIPTGTSFPAVQVDLSAAGIDLSSPLVKQFPQVFAPCPKGVVPAGEHVVSVDATIEGLLGACVRVTRQVVPVQTTLVVLDRDLIKELTGAGVPLSDLVVPCPHGAAAPPIGGAGATADQSAHGGAHHRGEEPASALPAGLAFTGSDPVPAGLIGVGLLWLGVLLTRRARAAVSADVARG